MTEQFHLARLQVINWGVFDGYHDIPFSDGGALIAGASGSGKSSLLDAISLGFLPFNRRNFNASGDNTAAGSSAGRRTVDKYVRGAWGQRSDGTTSKVMYLRGDGTAWSAIAVTYVSNTGRSVTGLVLKWLTGDSRSDSSSRFVLADGNLDIEDVCNRWAAGRFDTGVFKDDWRFTTKVESQYLAQLYATIGIRGTHWGMLVCNNDCAGIVAPGGGASGGGTAATPGAPVDLNTADVTQLDTLPGVGPATAAAIACLPCSAFAQGLMSTQGVIVATDGDPQRSFTHFHGGENWYPDRVDPQVWAAEHGVALVG